MTRTAEEWMLTLVDQTLYDDEDKLTEYPGSWFEHPTPSVRGMIEAIMRESYNQALDDVYDLIADYTEAPSCLNNLKKPNPEETSLPNHENEGKVHK